MVSSQISELKIFSLIKFILPRKIYIWIIVSVLQLFPHTLESFLFTMVFLFWVFLRYSNFSWHIYVESASLETLWTAPPHVLYFLFVSSGLSPYGLGTSLLWSLSSKSPQFWFRHFFFFFGELPIGIPLFHCSVLSAKAQTTELIKNIYFHLLRALLHK